MLLDRLRRHPRERRGQAFVEFAFVLPILALMLFATVDFSRMFLTMLAVTNGAREGARQGVVYANCTDTTGANANSIQNRVKANTDGAVAWSLVTPVISYFNGSVTPTPIGTGTAVSGSAIKVQVSTSYEPITPLVGPIIGNPNISASSFMIIDNPSPCATLTPTPIVTPTPTPTPTATNTPVPGSTNTPTPTATPTPANTNTPTATATATTCTAPTAPTVTSVTRNGSTHTVSWSGGSGAATYNLYREDAGSTAVSTGLTSSPATNSATGTHNHIYYVRGVNSCGQSADSNHLQE